MSHSKAYRRLVADIDKIDDNTFEPVALEVFRYQASCNPLYKEFIGLIGCEPEQVGEVTQIPFLPISVFKSYLVQSSKWQPDRIFLSSGTTHETRARHAIRSMQWYHTLSVRTFEATYGPIRDYAILALLPNYLRQSASSLVEMIAHLIEIGNSGSSGFYLDDHKKLQRQLSANIDQGQKTILIGVSYALLDFAMQFPIALPAFVTVMETGGMKGRRKEIVREELHNILSEKLKCGPVHSEYGMTELISQAYSTGSGVFHCAPQMRVMIREITDPRAWCTKGNTGTVQVVDLGNIDTCSFISTDDLGRAESDRSFSILGRLDAADIRGCSLLYP